jgi:hypothetical protein
MRLFRSHEQVERAGAIADTRTMFEGEGHGRERSDAHDQSRAGQPGTTAGAAGHPRSVELRPPRSGHQGGRARGDQPPQGGGTYAGSQPRSTATLPSPMAPRHHALRHALVADGTARPHAPTPWKSKGVSWSCATRGTRKRFVRRIFTDGAELLRDAEIERFDLGSRWLVRQHTENGQHA